MTIFGQAAFLIRRHPSFLLPPLVGALAGQFLLGGMKTGNLPALVAFGLLNLALTAGLIAMIRAAYAGEAGGWDAFLIGIGRHYAPILAGTLVMAVLALATLYPLLLALEAYAGVPSAPLLQKAIQTGATLPPVQMAIVARWATAIASWAGLWALLLFFLLVWKQAVVVEAVSWPKAWRSSMAFVRQQWPKLVVLLLLEGLALGLGIALGTVAVSGLAELGALLSLVASAYFTVALTVAFMGPQPRGAELDASA